MIIIWRISERFFINNSVINNATAVIKATKDHCIQNVFVVNATNIKKANKNIKNPLKFNIYYNNNILINFSNLQLIKYPHFFQAFSYL